MTIANGVFISSPNRVLFLSEFRVCDRSGNELGSHYDNYPNDPGSAIKRVTRGDKLEPSS